MSKLPPAKGLSAYLQHRDDRIVIAGRYRPTGRSIAMQMRDSYGRAMPQRGADQNMIQRLGLMTMATGIAVLMG